MLQVQRLWSSAFGVSIVILSLGLWSNRGLAEKPENENPQNHAHKAKEGTGNVPKTPNRPNHPPATHPIHPGTGMRGPNATQPNGNHPNGNHTNGSPTVGTRANHTNGFTPRPRLEKGHPGVVEFDRQNHNRYNVAPGSWRRHDTNALPSREMAMKTPFHAERIEPQNLVTHKQQTFHETGLWQSNAKTASAHFNKTQWGPQSKNIFSQTKTKYLNDYKNYVNKWPTYKSYFSGPNSSYYKHYWNKYFPFGFIGIWNPTYPVWNIQRYFGYPNVQWLYATTSDADVFQDWNGGAICDAGIFPYAGAPFPTQAAVALGTEMSALNPILQCNFRRGLVIATGSILQQISSFVGSNVAMSQGGLVINNYRNLQNRAVVIEGFVSQGNTPPRPFKADLDLRNSNRTVAFVPASPIPNAQDIASLDNVNANIVNEGAGADPLRTDANPNPPPEVLTPLADPTASGPVAQPSIDPNAVTPQMPPQIPNTTAPSPLEPQPQDPNANDSPAAQNPNGPGPIPPLQQQPQPNVPADPFQGSPPPPGQTPPASP